jgi:REP-associated tyrosine transposase
VAHRRRETHVGRFPVHVTMRRRTELVSLRRRGVCGGLMGALAQASRGGFRLLHFSIQIDHLHMIVEADDHAALVRGLQGLAIRTARAINRLLGRRGSVWADRHHRRALRTPREVRNAIAYVLLNVRKHLPWSRGLDRCSSSQWFDGWHDISAQSSGPIRHPTPGSPPSAGAATALLRTDEHPA